VTVVDLMEEENL